MLWVRGMWLWWDVPLPKGVSGQFISLLSTAVCEKVQEGVCSQPLAASKLNDGGTAVPLF